jgi:hypothetical protein
VAFALRPAHPVRHDQRLAWRVRVRVPVVRAPGSSVTIVPPSRAGASA